MRHFAQAKYAAALPLFGSPSLASTPLAAYASFYTGLCHLNLVARRGRPRDLRQAPRRADRRASCGEAAIAREAEAAGLQGDHAAAAKLYLELSGRKTAAPDAVLLALGKARQAAGDREKAAEAFALALLRVPAQRICRRGGHRAGRPGRPPLAAGVDRPLQARPRPRRAAVRARRYQAARDAFEDLVPFATATMRRWRRCGWRSATTTCADTARRASDWRRSSSARRARPKRSSST